MADRTFVRLCSTKGSDEKSGNKAFEEMLKAEKVKTEVVQEGGAEDTSKADSDMAAIMEAFAKAQAEGGGAADEFKESEKVVEEVIPEATEKVKEGAVHVEQDFQAETRQLLDIVTNSLYTDKEVFVRELVSNASDAMEKLRHLQATGIEICDGTLDLDIAITCDANKGTLTLQDRGLGMTREEMVSCIGTIARSGSKAFVKEVQDAGGSASGAGESIIGQFGVGFYSAFMVGEKLEVFSKSHKADEPAHVWSSDGSGSYTIAEAEGVTRGTKIVIHLKEDCAEYAQKFRIEHILKKYSNFVNFPIKLQGEAVNTVQAIWTRSKVHSLTMHYWISASIQRMTSFLSTPLHSSFPLV
jgi:hypothetical protein